MRHGANDVTSNKKNTGLFISPLGFPNSIAQQPRQTRQKGAYQQVENLSKFFFFCIRGLGVLPGSTARGSREEKWRSQ